MPREIDPTERAHLRDDRGYSPPIHRFAPTPELAAAVRRFWMPVWSLPAGVVTVQRVLQYPVCLLVIERADYALLVGPSSGLSVRELSGEGWALGTMLQPAAGATLLGQPVESVVDQAVPLDTVPGIDGAGVTAAVRASIGDHPDDPRARRAAVDAMEAALSGLAAVDDEGLFVNAIVEYVEGDSSVRRVHQICDKFAITPRSLQRLLARRVGLTPKWLIQRRRLHETAELLAGAEPPDLARVAVELGYSDQAHLSRDFRAVTGLTPRQYAAQRR